MRSKSNEKKDEVFFSAVDCKYFRLYGNAWAWSIYKNGMHGHIHVINPSKKDLRSLNRLSKLTDGDINFSTGNIESKLPMDKCYFASFRFLYLKNLSNIYKKIIITDVDSIIRKKVVFPKKDFSFFLREPLKTDDPWFYEGSKIAAGIVFINNYEIDNISLFQTIYKKKLYKLYNDGNWKWMVDQRALLETVFELKETSDPKIFSQFDSSDLSWEFQDNVPIWTGKGKRKFKNRRYLKEFRMLKRDYCKHNIYHWLASLRS